VVRIPDDVSVHISSKKWYLDTKELAACCLEYFFLSILLFLIFLFSGHGFVGADHGLTAPKKKIFRGGSRHDQPLKLFLGVDALIVPKTGA
jgi:hypothetical protein